jgi:Papain-like cysteine protease AvrRpt2
MKKLILSCLMFFSMQASAIEQQRATNWCWAASVQDVIAQVGIIEPQEMVAMRLTGWPQNRPAYINEVVGLVQSYGLRAWQAGYPGSPQQLYSTLTSGWKIIAFVRPFNGPVGHYIVLEGIDSNGNVIAADPASGITAPYTLEQIYYAWRWGDSVIVGR